MSGPRPPGFFRLTVAIGAVGLFLAILVAKGGPLAVAAMTALAFAAAILWFPFAGLVALVGLAQLGGLVQAFAPARGDLVLEAVAALVVLGVAFQSWREPRAERLGRDSLALRLALLFLLAILLSFLFAEDRAAAIDGLRRRVNLLLLFYLILRLANTVRRVEILVMAVLASTVISGGVGVLGYAAGTQLTPSDEMIAAGDDVVLRQAGAASAGPNSAAHALIAGGCIAAVLSLRRQRWRLLFLAVLATAVTGIVLTFSRSMAIVACLATAMLLFSNRRSRRFPQAVLAGALLLVVVLPLVPHAFWDRLSTLQEPGADYTLGRRLGYQLVGLDLLVTHPLLGVGPANFPSHYMSFDYRWMPSRTLVPRALHNMYLSVTVETGLVGIACFGGLLLVSLIGAREVWKHSPDANARALGEALFFSLAAYMLGCAFSPAETAKYTWILPGLAAALAASALPQGSGVANSRTERSHPDVAQSVQRNS